MKKFLITMLLLCAASNAMTQDNRVTITALDSIGIAQFRNKQYDEALATFQKELELVKQEYGENDSVCIQLLATISRCYFRQNTPSKALEMGLKAAETYATHYNDSNVYYANLLDNNALYYSSINKLEEAEKCSDKAVASHFNHFSNDRDMAATLAHAAEIKYHLGKQKEAVALQEHALNLIENDEGSHSQHYLNELDYMKTYYEGTGNSTKAQETDSLRAKLKNEMDYGYVPPLIKFDTAEKCREHNADAFYCCRYYLKHYLNADKMNVAAQYIFTWSMRSPDVSVEFGAPESKWMGNEKNTPYLIAYMAACTLYALSNNPVELDQQYSKGITDMLNYYMANKELTGEVPEFEEYLKLHKKSPDKFFERLAKDYEAFAKAKGQGKVGKVKVEN